MIKGLSERRRLPRLGKIHLGVKKTKKSGNRQVEYPSETDYFVVPPEVAAGFGEKPKALKIMFPVENAEVFFQQWYKMYGSAAALKCKGDGETGTAVDEKTGSLVETKCPCAFLDEGKCKQIGILQFLLPDIPGAGVWQITTSSKNSIIDINSSIDFIRAICGRIRMIPLILKREPLEVQRIEGGASKKSTHYTLKLDLAGVTLRELQQAGLVKPEEALLPPPDESRDSLFFPAKDDIEEIVDTLKKGEAIIAETKKEARRLGLRIEGQEEEGEETDSRLGANDQDIAKPEVKKAESFGEEIGSTFAKKTAAEENKKVEKEDVKSPEYVAKRQVAAEKLMSLTAEYRLIGGKVNQKTWDRIMGFMKIDEYELAIKHYEAAIAKLKGGPKETPKPKATQGSLA